MHIFIKTLTTIIIGIKEYFSEKVVEKLIKQWIGDKFEDFAIRTLWFWLLVFLVLEGFIGWNSLQQSGWLIHPLVNIAYIITFFIITIISMWVLWLLSDVVYLHYREIKEKPHRNYQIYKMDVFFTYDGQNNIQFINVL